MTVMGGKLGLWVGNPKTVFGKKDTSQVSTTPTLEPDVAAVKRANERTAQRKILTPTAISDVSTLG